MNAELTFQTHRPRLLALAYRLLGDRAEAEDVLQDAWLRWAGANQADIRDPLAWLVTATTRLGLDRLRAVRRERQRYAGPWLPGPLSVEEHAPDPPQVHGQTEAVSLAFLSLLEQLSADERAAFVLKEAFDIDYPQMAGLLGHSQANCRQLVHRARQRLQAGRPRFSVDPQQHVQLLTRFMEASQRGDRAALQSLLHAHARHLSDGGGVVTAGIRPLCGAERIARLYWAIARRGAAAPARLGWVNGELAILRGVGSQLQSVTTIEVHDGRIIGIYSVLNPHKLDGLVTGGGVATSLE
ncbi:RNA polymerase sigma factor SigJ [Stenotrophomonas sp. C3(2023)]|uniref:RNA polymerase sigma factor SigJ n=1 Tax=Stenotrophomonas sp. C3(2023) TaxID=3080277 RepID=UPI00293C82B0|nr:RNA polymerase sigma factor SigJ [Stenotrophomonas sp. C3(2023)]MDV3468328.1 RNA polymerase sigma factor SigJ [Stenotrophomonas sp. C3(2023)]